MATKTTVNEETKVTPIIEDNKNTEVDTLKAQLEAKEKQCAEYENAYKALDEKYNKLFNLFATTVDLYLGNTRQ